jgi:hypothetical protein
MTDARYDLSQLFNAAFGINSPIFITESLQKKELAQFDYKGIEVLHDHYQTEAYSHMGTPIIGLLKFKAGNYPTYNNKGEIGYVPYENFFLPASTLFSFRRAKNITKTNLLGSNGTVKEIFGFDDWIIDAKGLCLDDNKKGGRSAREKIRLIEEWVKLAGAIEIQSKLFVNKGIHAVVIDDYKQESLQGSPGIIPFSMTLISDEAVELILPTAT